MRLEAIQVSVRFGAVDALRDVTIAIEAGKITTVIGANGAGKSTLLNVLSGLVPITSGKITLDGKDITSVPTEERVRLGITMSPEGRRLFPDMTVQENLLVGAYGRGARQRREVTRDIDQIYDLFGGLARRRGSLARMLSGGEQQMCAIGRALMANPGVLLLDEPTLGLAPVIVNDLARIIRNIHASGMTIALVEQNSRLALSLADTGYVVETGRVVLSGPAKSLIENPAVREAYLGE